MTKKPSNLTDFTFNDPQCRDKEEAWLAITSHKLELIKSGESDFDSLSEVHINKLQELIRLKLKEHKPESKPHISFKKLVAWYVIKESRKENSNLKKAKHIAAERFAKSKATIKLYYEEHRLYFQNIDFETINNEYERHMALLNECGSRFKDSQHNS